MSVRTSIAVEGFLKALHALLATITLAPFLWNEKGVERSDEVHPTLATRDKLRLSLVETQTLLQFAVVTLLAVSEDNDLLQVEEFGDHEDGICSYFREVEDATLVVDVGERQRLATIGDADITEGVGSKSTSLTHNISTDDGNEGLDIDNDELPLG